jgi:hypothetical protein
MSVQNLGLGGQAAEFLGAYVVSANTALGLSQSPSTCSITLAEDAYSSPPRVFLPPEVGSYQQFKIGSLRFQGVVTSYEIDVENIGGRAITVSLSDPREIMKSIPVILAPGYRQVASRFADTSCSVIDAYGAYDDFDNTGANLSNWNQAGMTYEDLSKALKGGTTVRGGVTFNISPQVPSVFGTNYYFDLTEIDSKVDPSYRVNTNLINVADLIQELASRHSFDWYINSTINVEENRVDVTVKIIDRSVSNIDIDLDNFLAIHSGIVVSARRGYELRNEVACGALLGAPIENLQGRTITGLANNPIDLSSEGGSNKYYMKEAEMRYVLAGQDEWKLWVELNGGLVLYTVGGAAVLAPLWSPADASDIGNQIGINPDRFSVTSADEEVTGRMYNKLKGHAEATYGKRFMFSPVAEAENIQAAWTADFISGNNDPNEYFRNGEGKTRCYVEFAPTNQLTPNGALRPSFTFGLGANAPQALPLDLRNQFSVDTAVTNVDKSDWIIQNSKLYVAATVEEGSVVKLDSPIVFGTTNADESTQAVADVGPAGQRESAGGTTSASDRNALIRSFTYGQTSGSVHQPAYQPIRVLVPTKSAFLRYGPVFSSDLSEESQGAVVIDQDDGFAPWEFGSLSVMIDAMQFKIDNASSSVKQVEQATITLAGYPILNLGDSIGLNSNINNISVAFGNGVQTTYELRSFLRQFGELSKVELASLSLFARRGGARVFPQDSVSFINKYRPIISKQFGGKGSTLPTTGGADNFS